MSELNERSQINASGFPFQIRVEHEIQSTLSKHKWRISATEHKWRNRETKEEGFIDIILEKRISSWSSHYLVIECKRMKLGGCIFLNRPEDHSKPNAVLLSFAKSHSGEASPGWNKYEPDPSSLIACYCAVPGQSDKQTPMLERICDSLLDSVESLADELYSKTIIPGSNAPGISSLFIPTVVVNTELKSCFINPQDISLSEGELKDDQGLIKAVPYVRFQKSFCTRYKSPANGIDLTALNAANQRTVFIVHAASLINFLVAWDID